MWGSTFTDLAKAAQELQEQANAVASSTKFFNLDAIQDEEEKPNETGAVENAWSEQELDVSDDEKPAPVQTDEAFSEVSKDEQAVDPSRTPAMAQESEGVAEPEHPDQQETQEIDETIENVREEEGPTAETGTTTTEVITEGSPKEKEDQEVENVEAIEKEHVTEQAEQEIEQISSEKEEPAHESQDEHQATTAEELAQSKIVDQSTRKEPHPDHIDRGESYISNIQNPKKLLVLCSNSPMNKKALKRQETAYVILQAATVPYDTVDAADPINQTWRDELLQMSNSREYPQFFLIDTEDGSTIYWGDFTKFEHSNDRQTIARELTGNWTEEDEQEQTQMLQRRASELSADENDSQTPARVSPSKGSDHFYQQLERIEQQYKSKVSELEKRCVEMGSQLRDSNGHESCILERKQLQASLMQEMNDKEEQLNEIMRSNEGYKLKIDMLQREVDGTKKLLQSKDSDLGKASQFHGNLVQELQGKLQQTEEKAGKYHFEFQRSKETVERLKGELTSAKNEHDELKARAKDVATELKERRVECRQLKSTIDDLNDGQEELKKEIEELKAHLSHQSRSKGERDSEVEKFQEEIVKLQKELADATDTLSRKDKEMEKTLEDYKKKAQNSLAMANSRTAAAVQAREEAELEARAARSTADTAMDRAIQAETESKRLIAEAKARVAEMEKEKTEAVGAADRAAEEAKQYEDELSRVRKELEDTVKSKNEFSEEVGHLKGHLLSKESSIAELEDKHSRGKSRNEELAHKISSLEEQLALAEQKVSSISVQAKEDAAREDRIKLNEKEEEIRGLKEELRAANSAIIELKDALKNAVEPPAQETNEMDASNSGSSATPLFYAMEKQAELRTAQAEINRLANLLADANTDRSAAIEMREELEKQCEELKSKLRRYEKLSDASERANGASTGNGNSPAGGAGATNIEYLKNIMLSYLNAKSIAEKKSLIPVIGAVLELTSEEQRRAIRTIDEGASIGGVGSSLFEAFSGSLTKK